MKNNLELLTRENGWRKIGQHGGSFVVAKLFNILTGDEDSVVVRDYDYSDCSRDNDYWYDMPVDKDAQQMYNRKHFIITEGDTVMVIKGRKLPHGHVGIVTKIREIRRYGRWVANYVCFSDGKQTNIENVILVV